MALQQEREVIGLDSFGGRGGDGGSAGSHSCRNSVGTGRDEFPRAGGDHLVGGAGGGNSHERIMADSGRLFAHPMVPVHVQSQSYSHSRMGSRTHSHTPSYHTQTQSYSHSWTHSRTVSHARSCSHHSKHQQSHQRQDYGRESLAALAEVASYSRSLSTSRHEATTYQGGVIIDSSCPGEKRKAPQRRRQKVGGGRATSGRKSPTIVWFRGHDLRVHDHPALLAAFRRGGPVVPTFIWSPTEWCPGTAGRWWLRNSLQSLKKDLKELGVDLVVRSGSNFREELLNLVEETDADLVLWNRMYDPLMMRMDKGLRRELTKLNKKSETYKSELLVEPWELKPDDGDQYPSVHPYVTAWMALPPPPPPLAAPVCLLPLKTALKTVELDDLKLIDSEEHGRNLANAWTTGAVQAKKSLDGFLEDIFPTFGSSRCRRDLNGTSRLSPHIRFGEISPRKVYHSVRQEINKLKTSSGNGGADGGALPPEQQEAMTRAATEAARAFLKNLCLRDFSYHLYYHNPNMLTRSLVPEFDAFPWSDDSTTLMRWRTGTTGYPMVDAAMRQLIRDGWIHNNLRYLLASFVTKYLLLSWQVGLKEFDELLVDGDDAMNAVGWQWSFGSNTDAFPTGCLVNPTAVGLKQDPTGYYVRQWVPELRNLPNRYIHCPWKAPKEVLREGAVTLGETYPYPVVDALIARQRAQDAVKTMRAICTNSNAPSYPVLSLSCNDRVQEWPEEEIEQYPEPDEQITADKLGLLPSLWQMAQYDTAPPDLSNSRKTFSYQTGGNQETHSVAHSQQYRHPSTNVRAPSSSGGGSYTAVYMRQPASIVPNYSVRIPNAHISASPCVEIQAATHVVSSWNVAEREASWTEIERRGGGSRNASDQFPRQSPMGGGGGDGSGVGAGGGGEGAAPAAAGREIVPAKTKPEQPPRKRARASHDRTGSRGDRHSLGSHAGAENDRAQPRPLSLNQRKEVLDGILKCPSQKYHTLAKFLVAKYELTENTDRLTSKDYVRLCTMKDEFHRACQDERGVKIYNMKAFFSTVLQLEVTGEWDRHKQGGVRGPYVYGIREVPMAKSCSSLD